MRGEAAAPGALALPTLRLASPPKSAQSQERAWTAFEAGPGPDAGSQDGHVVGYSGYVSGASNFYGMSFGQTTTAAKSLASPTKPNTPAPGGCDSPRNRTPSSPRTNVPGYGGYLKGHRFKYANTFGNTVAELSSEASAAEQVPSSGETVRTQETLTTAEHGHIPGYAGFVRSNMHYYGTTYGESSRAALATGHRFREGPGLAEDESLAQMKHLPKDGHGQGYTGYVQGYTGSGSQNYFGQSFHRISRQIIGGDVAENTGNVGIHQAPIEVGP